MLTGDIVYRRSQRDNRKMDHSLTVAALIGCVSLLYATAGQAGGTAFIAVMALAGFSASELRPTALLLNIVAAGYATAWLLLRGAIETKLLLPLALPSMVTAFVGGLLTLQGQVYFTLTGLVLIAAALLMMFKKTADTGETQPLRLASAARVGGGAGFISGLTGVGGGVFLTPMLITLGWVPPRRAATLSPPFILCNSFVALLGALITGDRVAPGTLLYSIGAIIGAFIGTAIGLRWMSERATRYVLALILLFAGMRMVLH
jgi:hypothetical protein